MGCTDSKTNRPNLSPYFKTYSFADYVLRELDEKDLDNEYFFNLLRQLYDIPIQIEKEEYKARLKEFKNKSDLHVILVWVDIEEGNIIGTGTLMIEKKFSHNLGKIGKIEDVIVDSYHTNKGLEAKMVQILTRIAFQEARVYKVILEAKEKLFPVYEKLHFKVSDKQMTIYDNSFYDKFLSEKKPSEKEDDLSKSFDADVKDLLTPVILSKLKQTL